MDCFVVGRETEGSTWIWIIGQYTIFIFMKTRLLSWSTFWLSWLNFTYPCHHPCCCESWLALSTPSSVLKSYMLWRDTGENINVFAFYTSWSGTYVAVCSSAQYQTGNADSFSHFAFLCPLRFGWLLVLGLFKEGYFGSFWLHSCCGY